MLTKQLFPLNADLVRKLSCGAIVLDWNSINSWKLSKAYEIAKINLSHYRKGTAAVKC